MNSISDVSLKAVDALGRLDLASSLSYDFKEIYEEENQSVSSSEISLGLSLTEKVPTMSLKSKNQLKSS